MSRISARGVSWFFHLELLKPIDLSWEYAFLRGTPLSLRFNVLWSVARIPLRSLKRILDHSKVRFTANLKLALRAQTVRFAAVSLH